MSTLTASNIAQRPYSSFRAKYDVSGHIITAGCVRMGKDVTTRSMTTFQRQRLPQHLPDETRNVNISTKQRTEFPGSYHSSSKATNNKIAMTENSSNYINMKPSSSTISKPWENRIFYSSTRSTGRLEKSACQKLSVNSSPSAGSSSSSGTSIESIVPKYPPPPSPRARNKWLRDGHDRYLGSQKRVYGAKENAPQMHANKKSAIGKPLPPTATPAASAELLSTTFSSKFPRGLPFEEEFYKTARAQSAASFSSSGVFSHSEDSSGPSSLPFEDEFMRKPSNEPLYVDFSKSIPSKANGTNAMMRNHHHRDSHRNHKIFFFKINTHNNNNQKNNNSNEFLCKFESVTKGLGNINQNNNVRTKPVIRINNCDSFGKVHSNADIDHVPSPVVYVACASWVPKCNQQPTDRVAPRIATVKDAMVVNKTTYVFFFFHSKYSYCILKLFENICYRLTNIFSKLFIYFFFKFSSRRESQF